MARIKRSSFLFFSIGEKPFVDAGAFLRGEFRVRTESHFLALALLTGERHEISPAQLELIGGLSATSWSPASQIVGDPALGEASHEELVRRGWLVCDADDPAFARLRRHEELLKSRGWHPYAALYHFMDREHGTTPIDLEALTETAADDAQEFIQQHGPPPDPFHGAPNVATSVDLPLIDKEGAFYEVLRDRRTVRAFDNTQPLALRDLAVLLRYTFGCHGYLDLSSETLLLHKTSASGGSLHPIEAYPMILNVEGVPAGLYHYAVRDHCLEPIRQFDKTMASELAVEIANGQLYAGSAHAVILMTTRFFRNQWKYRRRSRTYGVMLMDAGHLGQTFYLVATELGLGAFFTAAINGRRIEEMLNVEPAEEGALAICGCGIQRSDGSDFGLPFKPFVPRKTVF